VRRVRAPLVAMYMTAAERVPPPSPVRADVGRSPFVVGRVLGKERDLSLAEGDLLGERQGLIGDGSARTLFKRAIQNRRRSHVWSELGPRVADQPGSLPGLTCQA
jgi:hypothetical protein